MKHKSITRDRILTGTRYSGWDDENVIMLVSNEDDWYIEHIHEVLSKNGLKTLISNNSGIMDAFVRHIPALVVVSLSGNLAPDQAVCQKLGKLSTAPIVVIASREDQEYELGLFAAGVDDVLVRPIQTPLLIARICGILRRYYGQEGTYTTSYLPGPLGKYQEEALVIPISRFSLKDIVMKNYLNKWIRKLHRWLAWPFIVILLIVMFTRGTDLGNIFQRIQAPLMLILAFTGAYLWLLPYLSRWQRKKRQEVSTTNIK